MYLGHVSFVSYLNEALIKTIKKVPVSTTKIFGYDGCFKAFTIIHFKRFD